MSGSQATARSRELLAVEHNDADAAHPGRILLAGGSEAASPSKVASPVKNGERGANGPIGVGAPRAKPDFSKLPKPPSALLAKLNAFMPKMQAANDTLKEAMKTRPAEDFDIEHVEDDDDASDSDSASDSDTEHMDAEAIRTRTRSTRRYAASRRSNVKTPGRRRRRPREREREEEASGS